MLYEVITQSLPLFYSTKVLKNSSNCYIYERFLLMKIFRRNTNDTFESLAKSYFNELHVWKDTENKVEILAGLIDTIRPKKTSKLKFFNIDPIIEFFKENEVERHNFIAFLKEILVYKRINTIFSDAGILP